MRYKIFPLGDNALTVEFDNKLSEAVNTHVLSFAGLFNKNSFHGFIEIVPAYASLTVFYDVLIVRKNFPEFPSAFGAVKNYIENNLKKSDVFAAADSRLVEIPVCFDAEFALDLDFIVLRNNLSAKEIIEIFLAKTYRVYMLGFLPGFAYMGELDRRIAAPRKETPRLNVPKGSIGIAGKQTGIYSLESPGGWQIIGRTNVELFTPNEEKPTLLQAGDSVKFFQADF